MKQFKIRKGHYPLMNGTLEVLRDLDSQSFIMAKDLLLNGEAPTPGDPVPEEVLFLLQHRLPVFDAIVRKIASHLFENFPVISIEEAETRAMRMIRECDMMFLLLWEGRTPPAGRGPRVTIGG